MGSAHEAKEAFESFRTTYGQLLAAPSSNADLEAKVKNVETSMRELEEATSGRDKAQPLEPAADTPAEIASEPAAVFNPPLRPAATTEAEPVSQAAIESSTDSEGTNVATSASTEPSVSDSMLAPGAPDATDVVQAPTIATE